MQASLSPADVAAAVDLVVRLGAIMLSAGSPTDDVERSMQVAARALEHQVLGRVGELVGGVHHLQLVELVALVLDLVLLARAGQVVAALGEGQLVLLPALGSPVLHF